MSEESLEKYEGIIDEDGLIDYDGLSSLIEEKNRLQYWSEEIDRIIAALDKCGWSSSDGDVHEIIAHVLDKNAKLEKLEEFLNEDLRAFVNSNTFDHIYHAISKL
jgi:hypothetical protein